MQHLGLNFGSFYSWIDNVVKLLLFISIYLVKNSLIGRMVAFRPIVFLMQPLLLKITTFLSILIHCLKVKLGKFLDI